MARTRMPHLVSEKPSMLMSVVPWVLVFASRDSPSTTYDPPGEHDIFRAIGHLPPLAFLGRGSRSDEVLSYLKLEIKL